jgi:hypothetical protein
MEIAVGLSKGCVLVRYDGFTDEELDFIINYDIKYRMGLDSETNAESLAPAIKGVEGQR